jgi:imidazolonepropionase-like amidohydrolase
MTTTTAAKIPAGPTTWSSDVKPVAFLATGTWTATNSSFASQTTQWIDKVEVFLVGQSDAAKEPAKTMNTWATTHATAITAAGLTAELKVSSWAILVDVTTKAGANANVLAKDLY